jgi:hypothetical protein
MSVSSEQTIYPSYQLESSPKSSKIKQREYRTRSTGKQYVILNYDNDYICYDEPLHTTQYRSVIMSHPDRQLLSFSPPRGLSADLFCKTYSVQDPHIYVNEMVEGTLVHLFYDKRISSWEIATKNAVGGNYHLSDKNTGASKNMPTVREMFVESLSYPSYTSFSQVTLFEILPKQYSFTFIMQHPANPILLHSVKPCVYLVSVYDITPKYLRANSIPPVIYQSWDFLQNTPILFPNTFQLHDWDEVMGKIGIFNRSMFEYMGCVATHVGTGERCVIKNPTYDEIIRTRKLDPGLFYQYLCLMRTSQLQAYLQYYPRFKSRFYQFRQTCDEFVELLHTHYLARYVWRNCDNISPKYSPYIDDIHRILYLPQVKSGNKVQITRNKVREYLFSKSPNEILYAVQYEKRDEYKRKIAK